MSGDMAFVYIEDDPVLGPDFYPASASSVSLRDPLIESGVVAVPREQLDRWSKAQADMLAAGVEMRALLQARRRRVIVAIEDFAGLEAAKRAETRGPGRPRGSRTRPKQ